MTKVQNGSLNKFYSVLSNICNGLSLTGPSECEIFFLLALLRKYTVQKYQDTKYVSAFSDTLQNNNMSTK